MTRPAMARTSLALALAAAGASAQWLHAPQPLPTGDLPLRVASADLDLDGDGDVLTLNGGTSSQPECSFTVLECEAGAFGGALTFAVNPHTSDVALGDVTGDGAPDAVTHSRFFAEVALYPGTGTGSFSAPAVQPSGATPTIFGTARVTLGDLDLDGWLDAVTGNPQSSVSVLLNDGAGALSAAVVHGAGGSPVSVAIRTLDGDLLPDVFTGMSGGWAGQAAFVLPGLGGGALGAPQLAYDSFGTDHALSDLDGDGDTDLAVARNLGSGLVPDGVDTALNDGAGHFAFATQATGGLGVVGVAAGDVDQDGRGDVLASFSEDDSLWFWAGDGAGGLAAGPFNEIHEVPGMVLLAELNGDARPDALVTVPSYDGVYVLLGNDGRLELATPTDHGAGKGASEPALADLDDDGNLDVVVVASVTDLLNRRLGDGLGGFGAKKGFDTANNPVDVALADLDADGDLDAVVAARTSDMLTLLLGAGDGNFLLPGVDVPTLDGPDRVLVGDVDGDLHPDVVVMSDVVALAHLFRGDGAGGLSGPTPIPLAAGAQGALGDLDGDLVPDLAVTYGTLEEVATLLNDGSGAFGAQAGTRAGLSVRLPVIADVDADGRADVSVVTGTFGPGGTVAWLQGDGAGGLAGPQHVPCAWLYSLEAGDLNGDGRPELAGSSLHVAGDFSPALSYNLLYVLAGSATGPGAPSVQVSSAGTAGLAFGDLDEDGRLDVAVAGGDIGESLAIALNLSQPHPWLGLGSALAGTLGAPDLAGVGWAEPGGAGLLRLTQAAPLAPAALFVSPFSTPAPFKGGVLVPVPPLLALPLATDAGGSFALPWAVWPALPAGEDWYFQVAVADAGAPVGVALSDALRLVQPQLP